MGRAKRADSLVTREWGRPIHQAIVSFGRGAYSDTKTGYTLTNTDIA